MFISGPLESFNQDQFLSFEKNIEWSELDTILQSFAEYFVQQTSFNSSVLYIVLRLVMHVLIC